MHVVAFLAALLASALLAAAPPGGAVERAADALAASAAAGAEPGKLAVAVLAPGADGLREPVETALASALSRRGQAVVPLRGAQLDEAEGAARDAGADALLRVRASATDAALALTGELIPTRPNFFLQRDASRPGGARVISASAPADDAVRALAGVRAAPGRVVLVPLAELPERVLALAAGAATPGGPVRIVAATPSELLLLDPAGVVLDRRPLPPAPAAPRVRDPAVALAVGDLGAGRIACTPAGRPRGELLTARGDRLERVGELAVGPGAAVPLAAGGAGAVRGAFAPGRGALLDLLARADEPAARPRAARDLVAVAAAPRPGRAAFAALASDATLSLLDAALRPLAAPVAGVGAGFALADLDGDGEPEVVASSATATAAGGGPDEVRVLRPLAPGGAALELGAVPGALLAGAAADATGDGLDDAILAAALPGDRTALWLVTADARRGSP